MNSLKTLILSKPKMIILIYVLGLLATFLVIVAIAVVGYYNWNKEIRMALTFSGLVGIATLFTTLFNVFKDLKGEIQTHRSHVFVITDTTNKIIKLPGENLFEYRNNFTIDYLKTKKAKDDAELSNLTSERIIAEIIWTMRYYSGHGLMTIGEYTKGKEKLILTGNVKQTSDMEPVEINYDHVFSFIDETEFKKLSKTIPLPRGTKLSVYKQRLNEHGLMDYIIVIEKYNFFKITISTFIGPNFNRDVLTTTEGTKANVKVGLFELVFISDFSAISSKNEKIDEYKLWSESIFKLLNERFKEAPNTLGRYSF